MKHSNATSFLLQLALLCPIAFCAGWFGSQFGAEPAPAAGDRAPAPGQGSVVGHLVELERRLEVLEQRIEATERQDGALGDKFSDLSVRVEQLERRPAAAPTTAQPAETAAGAEKEPLGAIEQAQLESIQEAGAKQYVATQRQFATFQMKLFADATSEGADKRRTSAIAEAAAVERDYARGREALAEPLREIYLAHWSRAASEIGPLVTRGLENADLELVRDRFTELMAETDGKVAALLEQEARRLWTEERARHRALVAKILTPDTPR
jgi:hypothetical protein